jgi:hypothetical protein
MSNDREEEINIVSFKIDSKIPLKGHPFETSNLCGTDCLLGCCKIMQPPIQSPPLFPTRVHGWPLAIPLQRDKLNALDSMKTSVDLLSNVLTSVLNELRDEVENIVVK